MSETKALASIMIHKYEGSGQSSLGAAAVVAMSVLMLIALAQISLPLPFTPVPITGQTFGVTLLSLLLGARYSTLNIGLYLGLGAIGLPVFASGQAGFNLGPTTGYLFGMLVAARLIGELADRGATQSFGKAWLAGAAGSLCVHTCGLAGLAFFIPLEQLLTSGLLPFLPGDIVKTTVAAWIASRAYQRLAPQK